MSSSGAFILAANALGNLKDIPLRAIEMIQIADLLVFEEDRAARQTLKAAKVHKNYLRFSEHHQQDTLDEVRNYLESGKTVLYMSDQGCPGLADPGRDLVKIAYDLGAKIQMIPGPSSVTAAIAVCPFDTSQFFYAGFIEREKEKREAQLKQLRQSYRAPIVILDTPYRLIQLLESCEKALGGRTRAVLSLDISGEEEQHWFDSISKLLGRAKKLEKELNFVLIIEGK